jgi:hypothetical protein
MQVGPVDDTAMFGGCFPIALHRMQPAPTSPYNHDRGYDWSWCGYGALTGLVSRR